MVIKRYLLFAFDEYYPNGGWNDLKGSFSTIEEAKEYIIKLWKKGDRHQTYQVVDLNTGRVYEYSDVSVERWLGIKPAPEKPILPIPLTPPKHLAVKPIPPALALTLSQLKARKEFARRRKLKM